MFSRFRNTTIIFVLCSLLLHTLTWVSFELAPRPPAPYDRQQQVEVEIVDHSEPTPKDVTKDKQQIVEQKDSVNDEVDEKAKFLSAKDQKVLKETRAANSGDFKNASLAGKNAPQQPPAPPVAQTPPAESKRTKGLPSLSSLKPQMQMSPRPPTQPGDEGQTADASATDDYLKDVETGLQTMLSTREFIYYSYYARIKERIKQHWEPNIRDRVKMIFRQGRNIASAKDHITQVVITLNRNGELVGIEVITPSGVEALDDAAVQAFRAAAPFPNPPKGLIDEEGEIKIRWDFVLEASSFRPLLKTRKVAKEASHANNPFSRI